VNCAICGIRKAKRSCPGVHGDICTICCGTERERTVDCPLECEYLREAHQHEHVPEIDLTELPNKDIELAESFLEENQDAFFLLGAAVFDAAAERGRATDYDVREALEALIRSYKASKTGLIYETKPVNPYAAAIYEMVQTRVEEVRKFEAAGQAGPFQAKDETVLGVLLVLQRLEYRNNNGRKYSRAFLDVLSRFCQDRLEQFANSPEPETPRIIL
jgi:hypothetical protein